MGQDTFRIIHPTIVYISNLLILLIISYFFYAQLDSLLYPFFLGLGVVALAYFQISFFLKTLLPSSQFVRIDLKTGIVNGVTNDSVGGKDVSWKFELNKVVAIQITWDDQPGALAILEILKSNHSRLHAFYGTHDEMRQLGAILEKSLHVACNDYTY